jgi:hypothetical protein
MRKELRANERTKRHILTAEKPNPNAGDQRNGTKNTDVREHTLLEKIAFVVSVVRARCDGLSSLYYER